MAAAVIASPTDKSKGKKSPAATVSPPAIRPLPPVISVALRMFAPRMFPTESSTLFFFNEVSAVISSGRLVPSATTVRLIICSEMLSFAAAALTVID